MPYHQTIQTSVPQKYYHPSDLTICGWLVTSNTLEEDLTGGNTFKPRPNYRTAQSITQVLLDSFVKKEQKENWGNLQRHSAVLGCEMLQLPLLGTCVSRLWCTSPRTWVGLLRALWSPGSSWQKRPNNPYTHQAPPGTPVNITTLLFTWHFHRTTISTHSHNWQSSHEFDRISSNSKGLDVTQVWSFLKNVSRIFPSSL